MLKFSVRSHNHINRNAYDGLYLSKWIGELRNFRLVARLAEFGASGPRNHARPLADLALTLLGPELALPDVEIVPASSSDNLKMKYHLLLSGPDTDVGPCGIASCPWDGIICCGSYERIANCMFCVRHWCELVFFRWCGLVLLRNRNDSESCLSRRRTIYIIALILTRVSRCISSPLALIFIRTPLS